MHRFIRAAALFSAVTFAFAACGSDDEAANTTSPPASSAPVTESPATQAPATDSPVTESSVTESSVTESSATESSATDSTAAAGEVSVEAANGTVTLDHTPVKIVSLSPTHTEVLFAIGAGDQVIAVDDQSNYPPEAEAVKSDLSGYTPNVEAIAGYEPDLVVMADDYNDLIPQLEAVDIPVWSGPAAVTIDDVYAQMEQLGVLTGHADEATQFAGQMQGDIEAILAEVPEIETPLTYYHELDNTYFTATSNTFIGQLYALAGLENIADTVEPGNDYPQLNAEYIVSADPQLIFLADVKCCGESAATVAARDGWSGISAVANGHVIEMDDDIASRWGPRIVDYVRAIVDAVVAAAAVPAG